DLGKDIKVTFFEPGSPWNDSIILIDIDGFRFLNLNDAGINARIAAMIGPVDMLASTFSIGASGYPLSWTHLSDQAQADIMKRACGGQLIMLKHAVELYGASYLLPFASHSTLCQPEHRDYVRRGRHNSIDQVVRAFAGTDVTVIDLLPGESWQA